jgi:hypothetical protein
MGNKIHDNELIAEFMELKYKPGSILWYNSSWNWLMPVVERIEEEECVASFEISNCGIYIWGSSESDDFEDIEFQIIGNKIDCVYKAVVKFIIWYNENGNKERE